MKAKTNQNFPLFSLRRKTREEPTLTSKLYLFAFEHLDWLLLTFSHPTKQKKKITSINSTFRNKIISNLTGDKQKEKKKKKENQWKNERGDELEQETRLTLLLKTNSQHFTNTSGESDTAPQIRQPSPWKNKKTNFKSNKRLLTDEIIAERGREACERERPHHRKEKSSR